MVIMQIMEIPANLKQTHKIKLILKNIEHNSQNIMSVQYGLSVQVN